MYMYNHRNVKVASPAAANGMRKGPMTEENSAGKIDISAVYSTSCPYDICICQITFSVSWLYAFFWGYDRRNQNVGRGGGLD